MRSLNSNMSLKRSTVQPGRVLLPLGLGTALSLMGDATLYTVLPTHTLEAGITLAGVGIILSANRIIRLFLNGPAGLTYDRLPRRRLFILSLFIGALSTAIYAATRGFWPLLAGRLLWGLAWSGIWVGGATIILDVTNDQDRGRWTGLYQTWFFMGAAFGALAGGLLTDRLGYVTTMWIGAAVTAFGGLSALILMPETRVAQASPLPDPNVSKPARWHQDRGLWLAAVLQAINRFAIAGVLAATLALLVQEQLTAANIAIGVATVTGALMAGRTLLSIFAAPLAGVLSDRSGDRWKVTLAALGTGTASMLLLSWSSPFTILAGILLGAAASGGLQALVTAITGDQVDISQRGQAIGLLHTSGDLGSAVGPPMAYALLPWIGLAGIYLICAALFAVGILPTLWYIVRRTRP